MSASCAPSSSPCMVRERREERRGEGPPKWKKRRDQIIWSSLSSCPHTREQDGVWSKRRCNNGGCMNSVWPQGQESWGSKVDVIYWRSPSPPVAAIALSLFGMVGWRQLSPLDTCYICSRNRLCLSVSMHLDPRWVIYLHGWIKCEWWYDEVKLRYWSGLAVYSFHHLLVEDDSCVMFWDCAHWLDPKQNSRNV